MGFLVVMALITIIVFLIYTPVIYHYIRYLIYKKKFQKELQILENSDLYDRCRIVITEPMGIGSEPVGKISFADAIKNQEFAVNSVMALIK